MNRYLRGWLWVAALLVTGAGDRAQAAMLSFSPATASAAVGAGIAIDVRISGLLGGQAPSLGTFDLQVGFDPVIVSLASVVFGAGLDVLGLGSDRGYAFSAAGSVGVFEVSFDSPGDLDALQGDAFTLFTLMFDTLSEGTSALTLSVNGLGDALGSSLAATVTPGSVSVTTPVPLPAADWLLFASLGGLAGLRRRRPMLLPTSP